MPSYDDLLMNYLNEHYAHARAHEVLRAQVVGFLTAAAIAVTGWAITQASDNPITIFSLGLGVVAIGVLSMRLTYLHTNRFDAHLNAARKIRGDLAQRLTRTPGSVSIDDARKAFADKKRGELSRTWYVVSAMIAVSGIALCIFGLLRSGKFGGVHGIISLLSSEP
jgi:hypothetical protein